MAAFMPFAVATASVSGLGAAIVPGPLAGPSGNATIVAGNKNFPTLYIVNTSPGPVWFRLTTETSTAAATQSDLCLPPNAGRMFANPAPLGTVQIAVIATITTTTVVYVSPGQGGI